MQGSTKRWRQLRQVILRRDGWTCAYCGAEATHVDHVTPTSKGGAMYDEHNLVASCARCNLSKGTRKQPKAFFGSGVHSRLCLRVPLSPDTAQVVPSPFQIPPNRA